MKNNTGGGGAEVQYEKPKEPVETARFEMKLQENTVSEETEDQSDVPTSS